MGSRVQLGDSDSNSVPGRALHTAIGSVGLSLSRALTNVLIGRIAGPASLGTVTTALSTANVVALVGPTSLQVAASRYVAYSNAKYGAESAGQVARFVLRRTLLLLMFLCPLSFFLASWLYGAPRSSAVIVSVLVAGLALYGVARGVSFGTGLVRRASVWDLTIGVGSLSAVAVLLFAGVRGVYLLIPMGVAYIVYFWCSWPSSLSGRLNRDLRREVDRFVLLGALGTVASAGVVHCAVIAVRLTDGPAGAGHFSAALTVVSPIALIANSVGSVLVPSMSRSLGLGDESEVRRRTVYATEFLSFLGVLGLGLLAGFATPIVAVIWGEGFSESVVVVVALSIGTLAMTVRAPSTNAITSRGPSGMKSVVGASWVGFVVSLVIWFSFGVDLNALSVACGYAVGALVTTCLIMRKASRLGYLEFGAWVIKIVAGAAAVFGVAFAVVVLDLSILWQVGASFVFVVLWMFVWRRVTGLLWRLLLRFGRSR